MSEDTNTNVATDVATTNNETAVVSKAKSGGKKPFKKQGNNKMPSQRIYKTRKTREMKKSVEMLKGMLKVNKLTGAQRSSLAYFLNPWETETNSS
jgi:hypothetical protein